MLDYKALSVRQLFKVFSRVESYLATHYKLEDLQSPSFFLATNARMNIVEDMIDIYIGYIYDKEIKLRVINDLVSTIWNHEGST